MSITRGLIITAAFCSVAGFAAASPPRLNDVQYIAASRCLGIVSSKTLGTSDAAALRSYVDQQSRARDVIAQDRADQAREDAMREGNRATGERKDRLVAERDGLCQAYVAPTSQAGGGAAHGGGAGPAHTLP